MKKSFSKMVKQETSNDYDKKKEVLDKRFNIPKEVRKKNGSGEYKKFDYRLEPGHVGEALDALTCAIMGKMSMAKELKTYRKYVPALVIELFDTLEVLSMTYDSIDAVDTGMAKRNRKRWTNEEDEQLIEMAADGASMSLMGLVLDRTPTAVQTRISYLVGIERLSVDVAGKFIGWLDGELVEGNIDGTVSKRKS